MLRKRHSFITDILSCGQPLTLEEIQAKVIANHGRDSCIKPLGYAIYLALNSAVRGGEVVEIPARFQLASAIKSPQPATTAADLLAIERSLNEGLRKELDHTHTALTAALAMLTPEQSANLITKLQEDKA